MSVIDLTNLDSYQVKIKDQMVEGLRCYQHHMVLVTMRGRKTATACAAMKELVKVKDKVVVVCPPKVVPVWGEHARAFKLNIHIVPSSMLHKTRPRKGVLFKGLIVDECHMYKNYSKRTRSLLYWVDQCHYRIGLTGTPSNVSVLEIHYPLRILQKGLELEGVMKAGTNRGSWQQYWGKCINPRSEYPEYQLHPDKTEEFYRELRKIATVRDPKNVSEPKIVKVKYELTGEQVRWMQRLKDRESWVWNEEEISFGPDMELAHIRSKMRQIQGGFIYTEHTTIRGIPSKKWVRLVELIRDEGIQSAVVWYNFEVECVILQRLLAPLGRVLKFKGESTLKEVVEGERVFILAHPKSGGMGVDMSAIAASIYCGISPDYINLKQSFYRIAGQDGSEKANYILTCDSEVDQADWKRLSIKQREYKNIYEKGSTVKEGGAPSMEG